MDFAQVKKRSRTRSRGGQHSRTPGSVTSVDSFYDDDDLNVEDAIEEGPIPLTTGWTLYMHRHDPSVANEDFLNLVRKVSSVYTVQAFADLQQSIPEPFLLEQKCSYHLMRAGIQPLWEDPENALGGIWSFRIPKEHTNEIWKRTMLALIGEQFKKYMLPGDDVTGASLNIRSPMNVVNIWVRFAENSRGVMTTVRKEIILIGKNEDANPIFKDIYFRAHKGSSGFSHEKTSMGYMFYNNVQCI